jgi:hypothetical protein
MLHKSGESGHSCLIPDFRGNGFSFSTFSMMLSISLSYIAFILLNYIHSIPSFIRPIIKKRCGILSKAFSASIENFVFASVYMLYYVYWFAYMEPSLHLE